MPMHWHEAPRDRPSLARHSLLLIAAASPQRVTLSLTWSFRPPGQGPRVQQQQQQGPLPIPVTQ